MSDEVGKAAKGFVARNFGVLALIASHIAAFILGLCL